MWTPHLFYSSESSLQCIYILQIFQEIHHHHGASKIAVSRSFYIKTRIKPCNRNWPSSTYYIVPNIQKNHAQFFTEYRSEPNSNLFILLEHIASITFGSKLQIPPEIAIRLDNKSVSWQRCRYTHHSKKQLQMTFRVCQYGHKLFETSNDTNSRNWGEPISSRSACGLHLIQ